MIQMGMYITVWINKVIQATDAYDGTMPKLRAISANPPAAMV